MTYFQSAKNQGEADARTLRVVHAGDVGTSTQIYDINGEQLELYSAGGAARVGTVNLDSAGQAYTSANPREVEVYANGAVVADGSPFPVYVDGMVNSLAAMIVDSTGVAYSGDNPFSVIVKDASGAELDMFKDGDITVPLQDHGIMIYGVRSSTGVDVYRPMHIHDSSEDNESNSNNKILVEAYNDVYDPVAGTWNRIRAGQGYDGPGVLRVTHATDVGTSVNIIGATGSLAATIIDSTGIGYSGSNPVPVTVQKALESDVTGDVLRVRQVSGASDSVTVLSGTITAVTSVTNSLQATIIDSTGIGYSGSNPVPTKPGDGTNFVSISTAGADNESNTANRLRIEAYNDVYDPAAGTWNRVRAGQGYDGPGVMRMTHATDVATSVYITGGLDSMYTYLARTTNPTAKADGADVRPTADKLGRQLMRPVQVRELLLTAYVTEDEIQEVVIKAGVASEFHDLVYMMCANESDAAITLDIRQTTAGTIQMTVQVPPKGTAGLSLPVPVPQDHADASWTVQNNAADNSNTIYSVTALFSKEL